MKLCASPTGTTCMYQRRLARDQADPPPELPDDGGASAYEDLATFLQQNLSPDLLGQAEVLLQRFVDKSGSGELGADEPGKVQANPLPNPARMTMDQRLAVAAQVRSGRAQAEQWSFAQRFPAASRIRNV